MFTQIDGLLCFSDRCGAIAQLGERLHGMQEVDGSNPSSSTITKGFNLESLVMVSKEILLFNNLES